MERPNPNEGEGHDSTPDQTADRSGDRAPKHLGPPRERLEPGEIDLTGVVRQDADLRDVIGDAIVEARAADGELPEWGARAVARILANQRPGTTPGLHGFAATGRGEYEAIATELSLLLADPDLPVEAEEWINRLGTYLIAQNRAERVTETRVVHSPELVRLIEEKGPAFEAFLKFPDITRFHRTTDPDSPDEHGEAGEGGPELVELFDQVYVGSFATLDDLVEDVIATLELRTLLEEAALGQFADIDPDKVIAMAREHWDIIAHHGRYYLFNK